MGLRPQSWWHSTLGVWGGYAFTALAGIPASIVGILLESQGVGHQPAILIAITLAVLGGFGIEAVMGLALRKPQRQLVSLTAYTNAASANLVFQSGTRLTGVSVAALYVVSLSMQTSHNVAFPGLDPTNPSATSTTP